MRGLSLIVCGALCAALSVGCIQAPSVIQGTVVRVDGGGSGSMVVRDERPPNQEVTLSLAGCEIGADPHAGDEVRVAYVERDGGHVALRVMNLTRQAEVGKKASSGGAH
jgi:hypothetical protein